MYLLKFQLLLAIVFIFTSTYAGIYLLLLDSSFIPKLDTFGVASPLWPFILWTISVEHLA
jgi:hypothetical protein